MIEQAILEDILRTMYRREIIMKRPLFIPCHRKTVNLFPLDNHLYIVPLTTPWRMGYDAR